MKKLLLTLTAVAAMGLANAAEVTETITVDNFGFTKTTTYADVTYTSEATGIKYTGNMCKANDGDGGGMQFRMTSGKEAGLVSVENPNGYKIVSVTVTPSKENGTFDVYGSETAYADFKDLYDATKAGTKIGSSKATTTITPDEDYNFFGFRANDKAIYIASIEIVYETSGEVDTRLAAGLAFDLTSVDAYLGDAFTAPVLTKATTADVAYSSSNEEVATVDAATGEVTIVAVGTTQIVAEAEANEEYKAGKASYQITVVEGANVTIATEIKDGEYAIVHSLYVATPLTSNYGYLKVATATAGENGALKVPAAALFTVKVTEAGLTIQDPDGYYYYMTGTYNSLNRAQEMPAEGATWKIEMVGQLPSIVNIAMSKTIFFDPTYTSYGAYEEQGERALPLLYTKVANGVESVMVADENAPVEYFNLQGIRVANPENGIFIRRQGSKATKVAF